MAEITQKLKEIRNRAKKDYYFFCKHILGYAKMEQKPHQEMCDFLEPVLAGKHKTGEVKRKKLLLEPRGSFKSSVSTVGGSLWSLVQNPNLRILVCGETQKNATKFVKEIKSQIEGNEKFRQLFGNWVPEANTWRDNEFITSNRSIVKKESTVMAASLEKQSVTGMHFDLIFLDDPVSLNNINTPEQLQKTIDFYKMLLSVLEPDGAIVVVGTRYSAMDLYGWLSDPDSPEAGQVEVLCREAIDEETGDLLFPEVLTREFLEEQRKTQGEFMFACNPGEAPILMADWTTKPIRDVKPGDQVIGFEEKGGRAKLVVTTVTETNSRMADTVRLTMRGGHSIRCTPDHQWYTGRNDKTHKPYAPAKVGSKLKKVVDVSYAPDTAELLDWRYLAGMVDGEGSCRHGTIVIAQSQAKNAAVTEEIRAVLARLNIPSKEYIYEKKACHYFALNGGRDTKHRLLQWGKPAKKHQIVKVLMKNGGRIVGGRASDDGYRDQVVSITPSIHDRVYALTTGTGNYVVWGYASKNCQYLNRPVSSDTCVFSPESIKFYEKLPDGLIYFITLDPAISTKERSDYSAIIVNGVDYHHNWYIKHAIQVKVPPSELVSLIFDLAWEVRDQLMCFAMEKFSLEQVIKINLLAEMEKRKWAFPIKELPTDTRVSKENRIRALQPRFQNGQVFIRKDQKALYHQLLYYPQGVKNDDLVDALKSQLQITFPSPHLVDKPKDKDNSHLSVVEREIWDGVKRLGTRRVHRRRPWA